MKSISIVLLALCWSWAAACADSETPQADLYRPVIKDAGRTETDADTPKEEASAPEPDAGPKLEATDPTVKLDGKVMTIKSAKATANQYGHFVDIYITGTGAPEKTEILISFQAVGTGCKEGVESQEVTFYPGGSSTKAYMTPETADCGLEILNVPEQDGDIAAGTFKGTIDGTNSEKGKTHKLEVTFAIAQTSA